VQDRRRGGRFRDDGPDGPLSPRGGPAPPGCVPRRSLVLPRSGPRRCREGGPTVREAARRGEIGAVPSVGSATTPHAGERERLRSSRARRRPGTGSPKGRLSPRCRDHVVVHVAVEPGSRALSETPSRRPEPTTSSGPTWQTTTPKAKEESTVRVLEGSQGDLLLPGGLTRTPSTEMSTESTSRWSRAMDTRLRSVATDRVG